MRLLILESPSKRKTIQGFLGSGWKVEASYGHITKLANDGPDNLGFKIFDDTVEPSYVPRGKRGKQTIEKLKKLAAKAERVYIATDPDREGEAIGWHLMDQLGVPTGKIYRVRYSEITEQAVQRAIVNAEPAIDQSLADAARARSILDKLVGYKVSPLLWNSSGGKSAGRVQSTALAIICRREKEILEFEPTPYWAVSTSYEEGITAHIIGLDDESSESADEDNEDDDADDGLDQLEIEGRRIWNEADAQKLVKLAKSAQHVVTSASSKLRYRNPPAPFTTSTLQQAAGARLGFSTGQTMKIAQQLFEGLDLPQGRKSLITYHRTDSPTLSDEFKKTAIAWLKVNDKTNVPDKVGDYQAKAGAQAAHEAIRPTYLDIQPEAIKDAVTEQQYQLYKLIWQRAIAACCRQARIHQTRIVIQSDQIQWAAKGKVIEFEGYARYWDNLGSEQQLPDIEEGQVLALEHCSSKKKKTTAPPRYSEARLVQTLERLGVGRPSTFAATVQTLKSREYIRAKRRKLAPTKLGIETYRVLAQTIPDLLDSQFTADMESVLDAIAAGDREWQDYLCGWHHNYFQPTLKKARGFVEANYDSNLPDDELTQHTCPVCTAALEKHFYTKDGAEKSMLHCSGDCDNVAFFWTRREQWWSPDHGELEAS